MLDALRTQLKQGSGTGLSAMLCFNRKRVIAAKKKTKLSAVMVNRAMLLAEKAGLAVTDISVQTDGSFSLSVSPKAGKAKASANPWDTLL